MTTPNSITTEKKYQQLRDILKGYSSVLIAFSGGVDSTFLIKVAKQILENKVLAVHAYSPLCPKKESEETKRLAKAINIRYLEINAIELTIDVFARNHPDRCYWCKKYLFTELWKIAKEKGIKTLCEGSNADDMADYRPGLKALKELCVRSPIAEAGLTKSEVRQLSRQLGLPTWNKPAFACLASRLPYGEKVTEDKLYKIEQAENIIKKFLNDHSQYRVRYHGNMAKIEVSPDNFNTILQSRMEIISGLKSLGFQYVTLDIEGYRTGSLNEPLNSFEKEKYL